MLNCCQDWIQAPQGELRHKFVYEDWETGEIFNYCRNPSDDRDVSRDTAWCYVNNFSSKKQCCTPICRKKLGKIYTTCRFCFQFESTQLTYNFCVWGLLIIGRRKSQNHHGKCFEQFI